MKFDFSGKSVLTVMLQCSSPEIAIGRIRNANALGAEAYGLQVESLKREFQTDETYKRIVSEAGGRPVYATCYRYCENEGRSDGELAEEILSLADSGISLCDVMGDLFDPRPDQMATDESAIKRQTELIDGIHKRGAEVLMSAHVMKFLNSDGVLKIALEQRRRGADVIKIVTAAENAEEELENLKTTLLLKKELDCPFLFLSVGECSIHRRIGGKLGNSLTLCVYEHDAFSTPSQPLLKIAKAVRDDMGF